MGGDGSRATDPCLSAIRMSVVFNAGPPFGRQSRRDHSSESVPWALTRWLAGWARHVVPLKARASGAENRLREELAKRGALERDLAELQEQKRSSTQALRERGKSSISVAPHSSDDRGVRRSHWASDDDCLRHEIYLAWVDRVARMTALPVRDVELGAVEPCLDLTVLLEVTSDVHSHVAGPPHRGNRYRRPSTQRPGATERATTYTKQTAMHAGTHGGRHPLKPLYDSYLQCRKMAG